MAAKNTRSYSKASSTVGRSWSRSEFRQSRPLAATSRAVAAPVVVRSWTGTSTKVHRPANHGAWLHIALFLEDLPQRGADRAELATHEAATGGACVDGPHGNHGENNPLITVTAGVKL